MAEVAKSFKDGSRTMPAIEYPGGDGIKFNVLDDNSGLVTAELLEEKIRPDADERKVLPADMFHMPAKVKLECIVSVSFKADTCRAMLSCKRVYFIKPLAAGQYKQLNELPEEPEGDAEYFLEVEELEHPAVEDEAAADAAAAATAGQQKRDGGGAAEHHTAAAAGGAAAATAGKQKRDGGGRAQKKAKTTK